MSARGTYRWMSVQTGGPFHVLAIEVDADMKQATYFQPVAFHRTEPERLLLTDQGQRWYLWLGYDSGDPVQIPVETARYITARDEIERLTFPRMWFAVEDLPTRV